MYFHSSSFKSQTIVATQLSRTPLLSEWWKNQTKSNLHVENWGYYYFFLLFATLQYKPRFKMNLNEGWQEIKCVIEKGVKNKR